MTTLHWLIFLTKHAVLKHINGVFFQCNYLFTILVELPLLHTFGGIPLLKVSSGQAHRTTNALTLWFLNTLVWSNPACFSSKLNCSFNKHLLSAYCNPGCVRCWRLSSKLTTPVLLALMGCRNHWSFILQWHQL